MKGTISKKMTDSTNKRPLCLVNRVRTSGVYLYFWKKFNGSNSVDVDQSSLFSMTQTHNMLPQQSTDKTDAGPLHRLCSELYVCVAYLYFWKKSDGLNSVDQSSLFSMMR